ncbi:DedA family protein [Nocardioides jensenii]|uniref:DedA family protein n=1 Tax=Nocardioides jensenii TaxID=1843 RepID=UPI00083690A7|nr:VTT domain-containing protein [Nocardioides jensenii]
MHLPEGSGSTVWAIFFAVVFLRAQATYWIARVVTQQALDHTAPTSGPAARLHAWLEGSSARRGIESLRRWGAIAVPLSFLTVGAQTVVNAGAGVIRMPAWRYTLVMLPGCAAWALVWTTIGLSAFYAAIGSGLSTRCGIGVAFAVVIVVGLLIGLVRRSRRTA